ncbi:hypothetical protein V8C86DRAFT_2754041 [Haematococcus lacustris]
MANQYSAKLACNTSCRCSITQHATPATAFRTQPVQPSTPMSITHILKASTQVTLQRPRSHTFACICLCMCTQTTFAKTASSSARTQTMQGGNQREMRMWVTHRAAYTPHTSCLSQTPHSSTYHSWQARQVAPPHIYRDKPQSEAMALHVHTPKHVARGQSTRAVSWVGVFSGSVWVSPREWCSCTNVGSVPCPAWGVGACAAHAVPPAPRGGEASAQLPPCCWQ